MNWKLGRIQKQPPEFAVFNFELDFDVIPSKRPKLLEVRVLINYADVFLDTGATIDCMSTTSITEAT